MTDTATAPVKTAGCLFLQFEGYTGTRTIADIARWVLERAECSAHIGIYQYDDSVQSSDLLLTMRCESLAVMERTLRKERNKLKETQ